MSFSSTSSYVDCLRRAECAADTATDGAIRFSCSAMRDGLHQLQYPASRHSSDPFCYTAPRGSLGGSSTYYNDQFVDVATISGANGPPLPPVQLSNNYGRMENTGNCAGNQFADHLHCATDAIESHCLAAPSDTKSGENKIDKERPPNDASHLSQSIKGRLTYLSLILLTKKYERTHPSFPNVF